MSLADGLPNRHEGVYPPRKSEIAVLIISPKCPYTLAVSQCPSCSLRYVPFKTVNTSVCTKEVRITPPAQLLASRRPVTSSWCILLAEELINCGCNGPR